jgi:hypothetical protein
VGVRTHAWADADVVAEIERHTWLNSIVGLLDTAFQLTDEELFFTSQIVKRLLEALLIPERGQPAQVPAVVAVEAEAGVLSEQINGSRSAGVPRLGRVAKSSDTVVTLEAWRQALLSLITSAYPDLEPLEVAVATQILDELLVALGLPARAALYFPDEVVRAHLSGA